MKAIFQEKYGKSDVLIIGEQPPPSVKDNQLLIKNHCTSVNPRDWLIRSGRYQLQFLVPKFPLILGSDFSGEVVAVGRKVKDYQIGDKVYGMKNPTQGLATYAELVAANEKSVALIPANITFQQAAGVPLCALTAWQALTINGESLSTKKVLIIGASGGVGSYAVQIAKALGANVTGVCSSSNAELVKSLRVDHQIYYDKEDFLDAHDQFDIIFDTIGKHCLSICSNNLVSDGLFVSTVPHPKNIVELVLTKVKRTIRTKVQQSKLVMVKPDGKKLELISALIQQGKLSPLIDSVFPIAEVKEAHDYSRSLRAKGKIILNLN